jgi:hypothetical protein
MPTARSQQSLRRKDFDGGLVSGCDDSLVRDISFVSVPKRNTDPLSHRNKVSTHSLRPVRYYETSLSNHGKTYEEGKCYYLSYQVQRATVPDWCVYHEGHQRETNLSRS